MKRVIWFCLEYVMWAIVSILASLYYLCELARKHAQDKQSKGRPPSSTPTPGEGRPKDEHGARHEVRAGQAPQATEAQEEDER